MRLEMGFYFDTVLSTTQEVYIISLSSSIHLFLPWDFTRGHCLILVHME
jgi:hypothetical protein